ncbi:MAG TPA: D-alanine--D-alanine ligase, partial [Psychrobacter sp.]|nr:D-alanine--D-alanine ligase [Psychrobacter sp.]
MTINNQENIKQENIKQKNESNIDKSINADAKATIVNPDLALAAAAQAQQDNAASNEQNDKAVPSIANSKVKDASQFGKVAVICGGSSNERSVSLDSGAAVLKALQNKGVDATHFDPKDQDITELRKFDRVFNVLHGRGGEDGLLQGVLQWFNIPQTGSGILASALGMDKVRTKQLWQGCGLSTAPFSLLTADTDWQQVVNMLGLPLI